MILTVTPNPSVDRTLEVRGFRAGGTFKARLLALRPAGKGLNVSRCLDALGVPSVAAGLVGARELEEFRASFEGTRVEPDFVGVASPVRTSTTIVDPLGGGETHVRERGGKVSAAEIDALEAVLLARVATPRPGGSGEWVAACGSLPEGMSAERYARLLAAARAPPRPGGRGARIALDSSGEGLRAARELKPDIVKPNRAELQALSGREVESFESALEAARSLVGECVGTVLVTLGAEGALLVGDPPAGGEGYAFRASCEPEGFVTPRPWGSSVGAGDAALAGYLWAETRGEPADACLRAAVAAGAASVAEPVAGALDRERFERLLRRAVVEAV